MKITFRGVEFDLKYSLRITFYWEKLIKEMGVDVDSTYSEYLLCYSTIIYSYEEFVNVDFESFMDEIDNHPEIFPQWKEWFISQTESKKKAIEKAKK